jgi:hypothetical protein
MKPLYGTTTYGTEIILDMWLSGNKEKACKELMVHISVNKPETIRNNEQLAKETIEKYIEDNF